MRFYYLGQEAMANRGCEALIRSNTKIIRERFPDATFFCPSRDRTLDARQWPEAADNGIEFVDVPDFPIALKMWGRVHGAVPSIRKLGSMPFSIGGAAARQIAESDVVLMTGGDMVSLDYGLNPLYFWTGLVDAAYRMGKPTHLLAASVGPFNTDPLTEQHMIEHLKRYTSITVRETPSFEYLQKLGIPNVRLVADPAFVLDPAPFATDAFMPSGSEYLGFNVSPLVRKFRPNDESRKAFDEGIVAFLRRVATDTDMSVMLIPHVDPLSGQWDNSDRRYMQLLMSGLSDLSDRIAMTPDLLNAAQIKYVLGKCRYFMGARTHATIGAISQRVPTTSIAYSIKAVGINKDLFSDTRYVLPTPDTNSDTLWEAFERLRVDEVAIKTLLDERLPIWKQKVREGIALL